MSTITNRSKPLLSPFFRSVGLAAVCLCGAVAAFAQPAFELPRQSPAAAVSQTFGYTTVSLKYSRPAVQGRVIWGSLVPYGHVWRAGANEPSTIQFSTDVKINEQALPAGTYALFVLPEKKANQDSWTFVFSRNTKTWGAFGYDAKDDALRVPVKTVKGAHTERMEYTFENIGDGWATLVLRWESLGASLGITADFLETGKSNIAKGISSIKADDPYSWLNAARFYWVHKIDRKQALEWVDKSIAVKPLYNNLWAKAEWLAESGNYRDAVATGRLARAEASKDAGTSAQLPEIEAALKEWAKKRK